MRYAARTDSTHRAIVDALRKVGCRVADTSRLGGFVDLVVRTTASPTVEAGQWYAGPPQIVLMEVKTLKGKLTKGQAQFLRDWPEVVVVRSVDEALAAVGVKA